MTVFESLVHIEKPLKEIYQFLSNLNNHQQLMPPLIQNWRSTADEASFSIQAMANLHLVVTNRTEDAQIDIEAVDNPPFAVSFKWLLAQEAGYTSVQYSITANLNMMMKMMAAGPLQKLADHETRELAGVFS